MRSQIGGRISLTRIGRAMTWFKSKRQRVQEFSDSKPPESDEEFVSGCGVSSATAHIAIGVRRVIARLGSVEPAFICHDDLFEGRIDRLPFWDSLDTIGIVMELEEEFGVKIDDAKAQRIRHPELTRKLTVKDFVSDVVIVLLQP